MKKALIGFVLATSLIGNGVLSTPVIHTKEESGKFRMGKCRSRTI